MSRKGPTMRRPVAVERWTSGEERETACRASAKGRRGRRWRAGESIGDIAAAHALTAAQVRTVLLRLAQGQGHEGGERTPQGGRLSAAGRRGTRERGRAGTGAERT